MKTKDKSQLIFPPLLTLIMVLSSNSKILDSKRSLFVLSSIS